MPDASRYECVIDCDYAVRGCEPRSRARRRSCYVDVYDYYLVGASGDRRWGRSSCWRATLYTSVAVDAWVDPSSAFAPSELYFHGTVSITGVRGDARICDLQWA